MSAEHSVELLEVTDELWLLLDIEASDHLSHLLNLVFWWLFSFFDGCSRLINDLFNSASSIRVFIRFLFLGLLGAGSTALPHLLIHLFLLLFGFAAIIVLRLELIGIDLF